jgi:hypothetical protein
LAIARRHDLWATCVRASFPSAVRTVAALVSPPRVLVQTLVTELAVEALDVTDQGDITDLVMYAGVGVDTIGDVPRAGELVERLWEECLARVNGNRRSKSYRDL